MNRLTLAKTLGLMLIALLVVSCGGKQQSQPEQQQAKPVPKLAKKYDTLLFAPFTIKEELANDYPQAASELESSAMTALQMGKQFARVDAVSGDVVGSAGTLVVKAKITEMRIVSGAARFWGGAMAGSSGVELDLRLVDSVSNKVVREEKLSSWNNAWGAAWTGGSTDNSLLSDMGKIVAQYITDSMPAK